eukprot:CAMPEP_0113313082 /NCGR_PEP_ID=MMETSP0010_2-20120614/9645_1 /TAXON_ID=216773 ORGANISM="Corethron hystrix, Strain 308" /NCGR_SAMPLE_ID=MMETSP0010_2 /ASSEMBLY_ACC=CAM_ASM_000155 /LENGTH=491 /DNA_ID=CAMNT_0000169017 /DNA_START=34 /DNA_END=1509 /DNA_ORIENTATION=+ /assembly_acc=CAM_ASM_000155
MRFSHSAVILAFFSATADAWIPGPTNYLTKLSSTNRLSHVSAASGALHATPPSSSAFLTPELASAAIDAAQGTPLYVYDLEKLQKSADECLAFPNAFGLTVRYAMKSCPNKAILQAFHKKGIHIDASSGYEVKRAISSGIPASNISLSTQELPANFAELADIGVKINACSLSQLERIGKHYANKGMKVGIRVNPGVGSGGFSSSTTTFSKTNVGGPSSSFGIYFTSVDDGTVASIVEKYGLVVERVHTHIGSGSDPKIWQQVALRSLSFCKAFDTVVSLNLGGGYKVARVPGEQSTNLQECGGPVSDAFRQFAEETGRELALEIEPGTYLVAMAGALVSTIQDIVETTGEDGHKFLKLDAGMTDVLRPSLYGAVHPMTLFPGSGKSEDIGGEEEDVVVVGHCCESGDLMTPAPGEPEELGERTLRKAEIGDTLIMDGSGAYCSSMSTKHYNSFPEAPEVLLDTSGGVHVIRKQQPLEQIYQNEVEVSESIL